jgi:hypothetical protein
VLKKRRRESKAHEVDVQNRRGKCDDCKARVEKYEVEEDGKGLKAKTMWGMCAKTDVVGAHGT